MSRVILLTLLWSVVAWTSTISRLAEAVQVSASYDAFQGTSFNLTNPAGPLPTKTAQFLPAPADFSGLTSLAYPPPPPTPFTPVIAVDTVRFDYPLGAPGTGSTVEMYGDAISSIANLGTGAIFLDLTLTNFRLENFAGPAVDEYLYLNFWETFTNLPAGIPLRHFGTARAIGTASTPTANQHAFIEPIVTVLDPITGNWMPISFFFGLNGSSPIQPVAGFISGGGSLTLGVEAILGLRDAGGSGGAFVDLPTSLEISIELRPVPEPTSLVLVGLASVGALGLARRRAKDTSRGGCSPHGTNVLRG